MAITLSTIRSGILMGALVTPTFDTAKNPSEGGISGRKSMRDEVIRNYMLGILQGAPAIEFQEVLFSMLGERYPFAVKDWANNYKVANEPLAWTAGVSTTTAPLIRKFTPSTGSLSFTERVLVPDTTDVPLTVKYNGNALPHGGVSFTVSQPGIIVVDTVLSGMDTLTWSGEYLIAVFVDGDASYEIVDGLDSTGDILFEFKSVRLKQCLEAELTPYVT